MDQLFKSLPDIIKAAAQSQLGILALLVVALSILAYVFFAKAAVKIRVGIFVLLFAGVFGFGVAMFHASDANPSKLPGVGAPAPVLSKEARSLLVATASDPSGYLLYEKFGASVDLHTNGASLFTDKSDHRALATWESALKELADQGLLVAHGERGEVYEITRKGYEAAAAESRSARLP
ncbi:hypothetical protein PFX98_15255 [Paucibacter sediminis]|uniref:Uncharacterized protein n=1 Tax=Paucibacter sediminis TaxID=3019553 RepID=A0AA95NIP0_9BURK|nr:hypothetical protein [Paucibacter sp. S2-9]WIT10271.1 hypothetical protein PFX98_15255 [Paucibacter sp. S2-9]